MEINFDPYRQGNFDALVEAWLPLAYAANSLNYSMGQPDLYPFVLVPTVLGKLRFVHGLIHRPSGQEDAVRSPGPNVPARTIPVPRRKVVRGDAASSRFHRNSNGTEIP